MRSFFRMSWTLIWIRLAPKSWWIIIRSIPLTSNLKKRLEWDRSSNLLKMSFPNQDLSLTNIKYRKKNQMKFLPMFKMNSKNHQITSRIFLVMNRLCWNLNWTLRISMKWWLIYPLIIKYFCKRDFRRKTNLIKSFSILMREIAFQSQIL